jgi:predicted DNA binding CopG/RHH family protein
MARIDKGIKIPEFESEAQEARWWDEHKNLVEENLIAAMRDGTAQRGSAQLMRNSPHNGLAPVRPVKEARASKNITIRMPLADLERARLLSARKGLAYQTYIKMLLHEALDREERRPVA